MDTRPAPAKVTRPLPADSYPRPRLFKEIDRAWRRPLIWITGTPGSGKTTLITDYLTRRRITTLWYQLDAADDVATFFHYLGLAARRATPRYRRPLPRLAIERTDGLEQFVRDYFIELYSRLKTPFALVLDNYQELPADSLLHAVIRQAVDRLPQGGHFVALSRHEPPAEFARARLNEYMSMIEDQTLRFSLEETRGIVRMRGPSRHHLPSAQELLDYTHGWAAGLTLMLGQAGKASVDKKSALKAPGVLFDYFASEVLDKLDADTRAVLLSSALLPTMTAKLVASLSGERRAGRILNHLSRNHFFTTRFDLGEPEYQYHPLFREFLLSRIRRLPANEQTALRMRTANLLEASEATEAALWLYRDTGAWSEYARCLQRLAPDLVSQGRQQALEHWLSFLPKELLTASPWMQYWNAFCRLLQDPLDSRKQFETAMETFVRLGDGAGARLAWCGGISATQYSARDYGALREWIDRYATLPEDPSGYTSETVMASMLTALVYSDPSYPDTGKWLERGITAVQARTTATDAQVVAGSCLLLLDLFRGNHVRADQMVRRLTELGSASTVSAGNRILAHVVATLHAWLRGNTAHATELVGETQKIADQSGVRLWDSHLAVHAGATALTAGTLDEAGEWLDQVERNLHNARALDLSFYHYLILWRALLRGEPAVALEHTAYIGKMGFTTGLWFADALQHQIQAIAWLQAANPQRAAPHIEALRAFGRKFASRYFDCMAGLLEAQRAMEERREQDADRELASALACARQLDIVNFPGWLPPVMARLAVRALASNIEASFVQELIRRRELPVTDEARDLETWPWPIRIYTFGRFSIVSGEKPIATSGRAPSRPIGLLAALLAEGGRGIHEERLCEILWPDAEGDAAHRAFDTTLHRLRKLLGNERALLLSDGKLSVNPMLCWVDAWSFERQLGRIELSLKNPDEAERHSLEQLVSRLHALYRGPFLGRDTRAAWAVAQRERLQAKYLRLLSALARYWEGQEEWGLAAEAYEKAIDVQPSTEEYYQRLILAYQQLGRAADADAMYQRCCQTLQSTSGRQPSAQIETLIRKTTAAD